MMIDKKNITLVVLLVSLYNFTFSQVHQFNNPIAQKRADPWVLKVDSCYYFVATVPEYDRIIMRKSYSINGLKNADEKVVWKKHTSGVMANHIWAPELHKIDNKWYLYFAAGDAKNKWNIRMWVLSNNLENPMEGVWKEEGKIKTNIDSFSLDATTFTHKDKRYLIWAQNVKGGNHGTSLVLSEMANATTLKGTEIIISNPDFSWERMKYNVNEGPAVIKKNGKVFVTYSASATNENYCVGLLWIDENKDLLNSKNWQKHPSPVFFTNKNLNRYGPGHNSFTTLKDGTTIMFYHARDYKEIIGHELSDPNRATRARVVEWSSNGFPDFMQTLDD